MKNHNEAQNAVSPKNAPAAVKQEDKPKFKAAGERHDARGFGFVVGIIPAS